MGGGMCCICFGTLTDETIYIDKTGQKWDTHRGKCSVLAGTYEKPEHYRVADGLIAFAHSLNPNSPERDLMDRVYYAFVDMISDEDFDEDFAAE